MWVVDQSSCLSMTMKKKFTTFFGLKFFSPILINLHMNITVLRLYINWGTLIR